MLCASVAQHLDRSILTPVLQTTKPMGKPCSSSGKRYLLVMGIALFSLTSLYLNWSVERGAEWSGNGPPMHHLVNHPRDIRKKYRNSAAATNIAENTTAQIAKSPGSVCPSIAATLQRHNNSGVGEVVQMLDVYQLLPFDNPDGGVWKQGWEVRYDRAPSAARRERRLEVVVVPHSHNDPGWLKTFEGYFADQTRHILDNMLAHLPTAATGGGDGGEGRLPGMRFIYAEMSFFELWWARLAGEQREQVRALLASGVLEIVTGGWVMTDEANAHYYSIVMQLLEGHEFIANQLGYTPTSHWSIDPFGLSPTVAYILRRAHLSDMVIQRVHYSVKKHLAERQQLEFRWRQLWAGPSNDETDMRTHMMPFYFYDISHTCGPDPAVCCQFDFRRLTHFHCPWGIQPEKISEENMAQRAFALADQYRKKAELYAERVLLVPLGDDFRYDTEVEWVEQHANYRRLMEHMNAKPEWNIHARFGTLHDYFHLLSQRLSQPQESQHEKEVGAGTGGKEAIEARQLPLLTGDFFTYADRDDHYWSGYFTSRPFYKHLDRTLQHYLRSADILYTLALNSHPRSIEPHEGNNVHDMEAKKRSNAMEEQLYNELIETRRALSLFQHHDGVTGTAKRHVMLDYGEKMVQAIANCKRVITHTAQKLLNIPSQPHNNESANFIGNLLRVDERHERGRPPEKEPLTSDTMIVLFNPLPYRREGEVHCVRVGSWLTRVRKWSGTASGNNQDSLPEQQLAPVISRSTDGGLSFFEADPFAYELCFVAELPPWGFSQYALFEATEGEASQHSARLRHPATEGKTPQTWLQPANSAPAFPVEVIHSDSGAVELSNEFLLAEFNPKTGLLEKLETWDGLEERKELLSISLGFVQYHPRPHNASWQQSSDSLSGAYLFLPDGPAKPYPTPSTTPWSSSSYLTVEGPVRSSIHIAVGPEISQTMWLDVNARHLSIRNSVDLSVSTRDTRKDVELAMRLRIPTLENSNPEARNSDREERGDNTDGMRLYTDLNGFQMIRRRRFRGKLPLQAHFYPMPGAAFVESPPLAGQQQRRWRVSLLGRQALGVGSYEEGVVDVMLDRRLSTDDDRGLGEGVLDNVRTQSEFRLLTEWATAKTTPVGEDQLESEGNQAPPIAFHSLLAHHLSLRLHHPPITLYGPVKSFSSHAASSHPTHLPYSALGNSLPCDIHVVALRTLSEPTHYTPPQPGYILHNSDPSRSTKPKRAAALILHRFGVECDFTTRPSGGRMKGSQAGVGWCDSDVMAAAPGRLNVAEMFNGGGMSGGLMRLRVKEVNANVSLTLLHQGEREEINDDGDVVVMAPMELSTVRVDFFD